MTKDSIGDRMKGFYEDAYRTYLTRKTPVIIRLDGKAFHTFTAKYCKKSFDKQFMSSMYWTASKLLDEMQGAKIVYVQSDEISILLTDYDTIHTDAWFGYNVQKIVSISAAMATIYFNDLFCQYGQTIGWGKNGKPEVGSALFDARCFNIPEHEVMNYFIWRQRDWQRNSLSMYARQFFSAKQLFKKNTTDVHEMLHEIGRNWTTELTPMEKDGTFIYKPRTGILMHYETPSVKFTVTNNNMPTQATMNLPIKYDDPELNAAFRSTYEQ